jgi:hypothetical protein
MRRKIQDSPIALKLFTASITTGSGNSCASVGIVIAPGTAIGVFAATEIAV